MRHTHSKGPYLNHFIHTWEQTICAKKMPIAVSSTYHKPMSSPMPKPMP